MTIYKTEDVKDNKFYFDIEQTQTVNIKDVRYSLYSLIIGGDKTLMPTLLRKYAESIVSIDQFWSIREILDFQSTFFYDNKEMSDLIINDNPRLFENLETWLTITRERVDSKSGGFCESVDNINQKITDVINNIAVAKNLYDSILSNIDDFSSSSVLEAAKKMVDSFLFTYIQQIKNKLGQIRNLIMRIDPSHKSVVRKVIKIKNEMEHMTSDEIVNKIKDDVQGQLGYILSQFKELDAKAVKHLLDRACSITQNISKPFEMKSRQIDNISNYYSDNSRKFSFASSEVTQGAMNNGAYRYNPSTLETKIPALQNQQIKKIESMPNGVPNIPISNEDIADITLWNDGNGDARIGFRNKWVTVLGREGWDKVVPEVKVKLMRLQKIYGKRLFVNSGFRPEWYNKQIGGAGKSLHISGMALDITWTGFRQSDKADFVRLAKSVGFTGFGMNYPTFVHIDLGNRTF